MNYHSILVAYRRTTAVLDKERRTGDAVLAGATAVVARRGLAGTNMAEVAAEAGVSVGTVYRHVASKSDLVCDVLRRTCRHELDVVAAVAADPTVSPLERLAGAVEVFTRRALASGRMAHAMIVEPTYAEAEALRLEIRRELAGIFAAVVAAGIDAGRFSPRPPELTGIALVGAMSEVLVGPLSGATPTVDADVLVAELCRFALGAVGASAEV